jgi:hypothetical protein
MTTTDSFQKVPDYYSSSEECKSFKSHNTNPRYKNFNQMYFTAGDVEQFYKYKDSSNGNNPDPEIDLNSNVWFSLYKQVKDNKELKDVVENTDWEKYKNITSEAVDNTFKYIFDKFKKGIFIKIKDNKLSVFLPFSKHDYINEWSDRIKVDPKYEDVVSFIQYSSKLAGYDIPREKINWKINTWYGNNCLIRPEFPIGENDRGLSNLKDMLLTLCKERVIPDIELFINKRDFPLITRNDYEPYEQIYDMDNFRLTSHKYNKYSPILSMVTSNKHSDIPMPTHEDWARVSSLEEKFFSPDCRDYRYNFSKPWKDRISSAVFRGASTGCGVTIDTNPRLKLAYLSMISPSEKGVKLLDAGITKWNLRPRKIMGNPYLQLIEPKTLPFWNPVTNGLVKPLTPEEQANYKYIINVDGHVNAFRLSLELSMGSVVLLGDSKYRVWFRRYLIPYVHYVPVKDDLSNLFDQIRWCRENDSKCEEIAKNAKIFYNTFLTKNGILDYMQYLFFRIKKSNGIYFYNTLKVEDLIIEKQISILNSYGFLSDNISLLNSNNINYPFSSSNNNYYSKEGLRLFLGTLNIGDKLEDEKQFVNKTIIHQSHDTNVYKINVNENLSFLIKDIKTLDRNYQLINEAFCGITEINKLIKEIPHFRFTYGLTNNKSMLLSEYVEGKTLQQYISEGCTISELKQIFSMLCLALDVAQERCGFVHYDLYPWNIIIKKLPKKQTITYQLKTDIITIDTDIIPVIIDYGRVHLIHNKEHYGTIEPFKTSRIQDCFCMIVSCLFEAAMQKNIELNKSFYIVNFYSGTNFQKTKIERYPQLMEFLSKNKKYNEMIFGNKCDLEQSKLPYDMFIYLMNCPIQDQKSIITVKQISYPEKIDYPFKTSHPSFYYEVISKKNPSKSLTNYVNKINDYYESLMGASTNKLIYTNVSNMISQSINGVLEFINLLDEMKYPEGYKIILEEKGIIVDEFFIPQKINQRNLKFAISERETILKKSNLNYKVIPLVTIEGDDYFSSRDMLTRFCNSILQRIALMFSENYDKKDEELSLEYFSGTLNFSMAKYTTKTFSVPEEILSILEGNMILNIPNLETTYEYLLSIRSMMVYNFFFKQRFSLSPDDESNTISNNKKLMKLSNLIYNNYSANMNSLKSICKKLYPKEKETFLRMNQIPDKLVLCIDNILSLNN